MALPTASSSGRGIGRTKKKPIIIGSEVPKDKSKRNSDVSPGYAMCAMVENKNADKPKPERTRPVVDALIWSGNVFAVAFTALVKPPFPPAPVRNEHATRMQKENVERRSASPESGLS